MIVHKIAQIIQLVPIDAFAPLVVVVPEIGHVFHVEHSIPDPKEKWIVKHCIKGSQIACKIAHISIKDLAHGIDTCCILELAPKPFGHFGYCINSDPIDIILPDQITNPLQELGTDPIIFLFEIGQTCQSAVFYPVLILGGEVIITDDTEVVVMVR